jgi:biopolymer transport protein ExbD
VLLIIFMVTAKIIVSQAIPIDLPKAATSGDQQVIFAVTITPDKEGHVVILADKVPMSNDDQLKAAAKAALDKNKDMRTVIQASAHVEHGEVVHVLDQLRQVGITKIGFAVEKTASATGVKTTAPQ